MKFEFRLEKMLSFIRTRETMKKMEVSACQKKIEFIERRKVELSVGVKEVLNSQYEKMRQHAGWAAFNTEKINLDLSELKKLEVLHAEEREVLTMKMDELTHIAMRRKGLESLKDKRMMEFKMLKSRKEQKMLDENYEILKRNSR